MNPNFNVRITRGDEEQPSAGMHFMNNCIKRVSARMMWKAPRPTAKTMAKDTSMEGIRLFFGTEVLGSGDTNTARILMENVLSLERLVDAPDLSRLGRLHVSFLGEEETFTISEFTLISINADQGSSYVEFEVKVVIV